MSSFNVPTIPSTKASCKLLLVGLTTSTVTSPNTVRFPPTEGEKVMEGGLVAFRFSCIAQLGNFLYNCRGEKHLTELLLKDLVKKKGSNT